MGDGREGAHEEAPLEGDRHDAVHDEGDQDEVPGRVEPPRTQGHVEHGLEGLLLLVSKTCVSILMVLSLT